MSKDTEYVRFTMGMVFEAIDDTLVEMMNDGMSLSDVYRDFISKYMNVSYVTFQQYMRKNHPTLVEPSIRNSRFRREFDTYRDFIEQALEENDYRLMVTYNYVKATIPIKMSYTTFVRYCHAFLNVPRKNEYIPMDYYDEIKELYDQRYYAGEIAQIINERHGTNISKQNVLDFSHDNFGYQAVFKRYKLDPYMDELNALAKDCDTYSELYKRFIAIHPDVINSSESLVKTFKEKGDIEQVIRLEKAKKRAD